MACVLACCKISHITMQGCGASNVTGTKKGAHLGLVVLGVGAPAVPRVRLDALRGCGAGRVR